MSKALTMTVIFKANSLNYGEGIANIAELKKIHRGNGEVYTFASRQSIRYDIVRMGNELFNWNLNTVERQSGGVVQFRRDVSIEDSVEMDLFGYMKTLSGNQSQKRPAVARLSHSISLEPYKSDLEFLNNMGLAERIGENANLANIEQHDSLYTYTITLDLGRVGKDENDNIELPVEEKSNRVQQLLDILKVLNRNIKGRQESLSPLFVVGGVYPVANPFFMGKVSLDNDSKGWTLNTSPIEDVMEQTFAGNKIGDQTQIALLNGLFDNESEIKQNFADKCISIEEFFSGIKQRINEAYEVIK